MNGSTPVALTIFRVPAVESKALRSEALRRQGILRSGFAMRILEWRKHGDSTLIHRTKLGTALAATSVLLAGAACHGDGGGPTGPITVVAVYQLQTLDGVPLPADVQTGPPAVTVQADSYTLNSDSVYNEQGTVESAGSPATETESGTWSQTGATITFTPTDRTLIPYSGSVSNDTLTIVSGGRTAVYVAQP